MHVLTRVTVKVDCFGCLCALHTKIKYSVFYVYLCSCVIILCYSTCIFYAVVRQISMLFIDNKDSLFCIQSNFVSVSDCTLNRGCIQSNCC